MFLEINELSSAIYQYQLEQITQGDESIVETAIETAVQEVRSYLDSNYQHANADGRLLYDTEAVFSATGTDRNALILAHTKTVAIWHIIQLCNADVMYQHVKERYDRAIAFLRDLAAGKTSISSLPRLNSEGDNPSSRQPFRSGSRPKFNYE
jgi:phage gp36-like protein